MRGIVELQVPACASGRTAAFARAQFAGAVLLGRGVTSTVKNGIADLDAFETIPAIFAFGMLCALAAAGSWLLVATYLEMPVSTTHSIIGCAPPRSSRVSCCRALQC